MNEQAEEFRQQKKHNALILVAAARGFLEDVKALLERGAALDARDKGGLLPLHFAAGRGRLQVVELLWSKGADLDADAPDGRTALHLAAAGGHAGVASLLLQKGAWAEAEDSGEDTPLHAAAKRAHADVAEALLRHGVQVDRRNKAGLTAAGEALLRGHVDVAQQLAQWGAALEERPRGFSLLHLAAGLGRGEAVAWLLTCGADANECGNEERATPLHSAALGGDARCLELLLAAGADPLAQDANGLLPEALEGSEAAAAAASRPAPPRKRPAPAPRRGAAPAPSPQQAFVALPPPEQRSKAGRWAVLTPSDAAAALRGYPAAAAAAAGARLALARDARCKLNVHKALAALRADDDFQGDAAAPEVAAAVSAMRRDPGQYERYARDGRVVGVMAKMRRAHAVAQANGQRTVALEDMVVGVKGNAQRLAADAQALAGLEAEYEAQVAAAAAAAAAATSSEPGAAEGDAQAAYQAALRAIRDAAAAPPRAAPSGAAMRPVVRPAAPKAAPKAAHPASRSSEIEEHPSEEEAPPDALVPEWMVGEFSWRKVGRYYVRQMSTSLIILAILLIMMFLSISITGQRPWVPPAPAGGLGGAQQEQEL